MAAIDRIGEIDRAACRRAVEARFSVEHMAERYLDLYRRILTSPTNMNPAAPATQANAPR